MVISFQTAKLQKECTQSKQMVKRHGPLRAKLLQKRLNELAAAECLEDLRHLPQARCHELRGDRKGQVSVDLDHPYRLIFTPSENPPPAKPDGGLNWLQVRAVTILGVEDTHE